MYTKAGEKEFLKSYIGFLSCHLTGPFGWHKWCSLAWPSKGQWRISKILSSLIFSLFIEQNIFSPDTCFAYTISEPKFTVWRVYLFNFWAVFVRCTRCNRGGDDLSSLYTENDRGTTAWHTGSYGQSLEWDDEIVQTLRSLTTAFVTLFPKGDNFTDIRRQPCWKALCDSQREYSVTYRLHLMKSYFIFFFLLWKSRLSLRCNFLSAKA